MKPLHKLVLGIVIGALALLDVALNVFPLTNGVGASIVPSIHAPFIPTQTYGACAAVAKSNAGFPFDTEHYGACALDHSSQAVALDWAIIGLLAIISVALVAGRASTILK